jgi:hypothetical protein
MLVGVHYTDDTPGPHPYHVNVIAPSAPRVTPKVKASVTVCHEKSLGSSMGGYHASGLATELQSEVTDDGPTEEDCEVASKDRSEVESDESGYESAAASSSASSSERTSHLSKKSDGRSRKSGGIAPGAWSNALASEPY